MALASGPRSTKRIMRRSTVERGSRTRRPQVWHLSPMSAPRRTTSQTEPPQGCCLRSSTTSPTLKSTTGMSLLMFQPQLARPSFGRDPGCLREVGAGGSIQDVARHWYDRVVAGSIPAELQRGRRLCALCSHARYEQEHVLAEGSHRMKRRGLCRADHEPKLGACVLCQTFSRDAQIERIIPYHQVLKYPCAGIRRSAEHQHALPRPVGKRGDRVPAEVWAHGH